MSRFPDLPPVWFVGHLVASYVLGLIPFGDISGEGSILMGRAIIVLGIVPLGWSACRFWRKTTTIEPAHTPTTLIGEGPYRTYSNQIYTG
ncbi:MAG: isoprenylcysteine carboxylmethyltransferase family protein, partial [Pseudomonadota bacterium]